jgi:molybdopterin converting factor small subunit
MIAEVKFVGSFRGLSKRSMFRLKFAKPVTVEVLANMVVESLPKLKNELIDPSSGKLRRNMLVLVNQREISALNGSETVINDEDEIVFVPVMHGG